jgi:hypothetical protein
MNDDPDSHAAGRRPTRRAGAVTPPGAPRAADTGTDPDARPRDAGADTTPPDTLDTPDAPDSPERLGEQAIRELGERDRLEPDAGGEAGEESVREDGEDERLDPDPGARRGDPP